MSRICRAHAAFRDRGLELLVDDALVRGVLVDDDEAVAGLRHDIGLVHLRARRAERMIEQFVGRRGFGERLRADLAQIGRRAADVESGLRRLGKAAAQSPPHTPPLAGEG